MSMERRADAATSTSIASEPPAHALHNCDNLVKSDDGTNRDNETHRDDGNNRDDDGNAFQDLPSSSLSHELGAVAATEASHPDASQPDHPGTPLHQHIAEPQTLLQTLLATGTRMLKIPNKASSRPQERLIRIDSLPLRVSWESKRKDPSSLEFHSIVEIRMGANTRAFDIHANAIHAALATMPPPEPSASSVSMSPMSIPLPLLSSSHLPSPSTSLLPVVSNLTWTLSPLTSPSVEPSAPVIGRVPIPVTLTLPPGQDTPVVMPVTATTNTTTRHPDLDSRAFSIIYVARDGKYKFLNLIAPSSSEAARWVTGLELLRSHLDLGLLGDVPDAQTNMTQWLQTLWREVATTSTGNNATVSASGNNTATASSSDGLRQLDLDQVTALMRRLNMGLSKAQIKSMLRQTRNSSINSNNNRHANNNNGKSSDKGHVDTTTASSSSSLFPSSSTVGSSVTFDAFEKLYRALRFRPDVAELFSQLAQTHPSHLTATEFESFLTSVQRVNWSRERCRETYDKFKSPETGHMDMDHFSAFLLSARNSVMNKTHQVVFQDMTRPLNSYFINASHNTYLLGDQLAGESSAEGYIRALQRGCRCVEMDCWDGPAGVPVVCHGHTLTTRLALRDAVDAIARYAFVASPYPLILSLEIRCSAAQQEVLARTLREAFGEALLVAPVEPFDPVLQAPRVLPSPAELIGRVLIKVKTGLMRSLSASLQPLVQMSPSLSQVGVAGGTTPSTPVATASLPLQAIGSQTPTTGAVDDESDDDAGDGVGSPVSGATSPALTGTPMLQSTSAVTSPAMHASTPVAATASHALAIKRLVSFWRTRSMSISSPSQQQLPSPHTTSSTHTTQATVPSITPPQTTTTNTTIIPTSPQTEVSTPIASSPRQQHWYQTRSRQPSTESDELIDTTTNVNTNKEDTTHQQQQQQQVHVTSPSREEEPKRRLRHVPITRTLTHLAIYCKGVSLPRDGTINTVTNPIPINCMYSISEKRALSFTQRHKTDLVAHNRFHLTRVYPSVIRVGSSNPDPVPHWGCGTQMVALNFQTMDRAMQLNQAMFDVNGRCGFVLRSGCWGGDGCLCTCMRRNGSFSSGGGASRPCDVCHHCNKIGMGIDATCPSHPPTQPIVLIITIISAQQLPKPGDTLASDMITPYVDIELAGDDVDCARFRTRVAVTTTTTTGSFNTQWREEFKFFVRVPDLAFIRFLVSDGEMKLAKSSGGVGVGVVGTGNGSGIGYAAVMLGSLEQGYRHVPLCRRGSGERMRFSTLFVRVSKHVVRVGSSTSSGSVSGVSGGNGGIRASRSAMGVASGSNSNVSATGLMTDTGLASAMHLQHYPVPPFIPPVGNDDVVDCDVGVDGDTCDMNQRDASSRNRTNH